MKRYPWFFALLGALSTLTSGHGGRPAPGGGRPSTTAPANGNIAPKDLIVHTLQATGDLGVEGTSSLSSLDVGGAMRVLGEVTTPLPLTKGLSLPIRTIRESTTLTGGEDLVLRLDGGDVNLPLSSSVSGAVYFIKCLGTHEARLIPSQDDTIAGESVLTLAPGDHLILISNGVDGWDQW